VEAVEDDPSAGGLLEAALHLGAALRAGKESEAAVHIDHERIALKPDAPNRQPLQLDQLVE
jgi:hypothetical protein